MVLSPDLHLITTGDLRRNMIEYIRRHFGDMLGPHAALLDQPDGLDALAELLRTGQLGPGNTYSKAA